MSYCVILSSIETEFDEEDPYDSDKEPDAKLADQPPPLETPSQMSWLLQFTLKNLGVYVDSPKVYFVLTYFG